MNFNKIICVLLLIICIPVVVFSYPFNQETCNLGYTHVHHEHNESSYQNAWCSMHGGIVEYENKDKTRVDCLTTTHAVEFDFANKWHESIGQALHYGIMTGKKPKVVLILDEPDKQMVYFERVQKIAKKYKFDVEYVTNDIIKLNESGQCKYLKCKCHKNIQQNKMQQYVETVA